MISEARRAAIRRRYRLLRAAVAKTQLQVQIQARLLEGRYWKIENGVVFPTGAERKVLARVLQVQETDLPAEDDLEAKAS